jgi:hypothetical protein
MTPRAEANQNFSGRSFGAYVVTGDCLEDTEAEPKGGQSQCSFAGCGKIPKFSFRGRGLPEESTFSIGFEK